MLTLKILTLLRMSKRKATPRLSLSSLRRTLIWVALWLRTVVLSRLWIRFLVNDTQAACVKAVNGKMAEWSIASDCKSDSFGIHRFKSFSSHNLENWVSGLNQQFAKLPIGKLVQWFESTIFRYERCNNTFYCTLRYSFWHINVN